MLGYYDDRSARPQFQKLARLAEDTGGYATEVKQSGATKDFAKDLVTNRFAGEVLENGGKAVVTLKGPAGAQTIEFKADLEDGKTLMAEEAVTVPAAPLPASDAPTVERTEPEPKGTWEQISDWAKDNAAIIVALGVLLGAGIVAFAVYGQQLLALGRDKLGGHAPPPLPPAVRPMSRPSRRPLHTTTMKIQ